jgi:hypothetical protein
MAPRALVLLQEQLPLKPLALAPQLAGATGRLRLDVLGALKRNPYIPLEDLSEEEAAAAVECLRSAGARAVAVEAGRLPPPTRVFRVSNADALEDGLRVQTDLAGRLRTLPWDGLEVVAAATVSETSAPLGLSGTSVREEVEEIRLAAAAGGHGTVPPHLVFADIPAPRPKTEVYPALCLMPRGADIEMRIRGDLFNYDYLGERLRATSEENFRLLVGDVIARSTGALVNRWAKRLADAGELPPTFEAHLLERYSRWLRLLAREGLCPGGSEP